MRKLAYMSTPTGLNHSARRINYLAARLAPENYLEVGVAAGMTFLGVNIHRKVAVDPRFRFEFTQHQSDSVSFFQVTSDKYFVEHAGTEKFDIIFLDGLHTFEQIFRDFCNSLLHCHDQTVWIIDDTIPSDVYSAINDQRKALQARKDAGGQSSAWHGDVFKMVFVVHDFFPSFSYCTVITKGNPQTLIWKQSRNDFQPMFNNLETISRLNYFDFKENSPIFNLMPEEEGLDLAIAALAR